jgi:hypothetical protein
MVIMTLSNYCNFAWANNLAPSRTAQNPSIGILIDPKMAYPKATANFQAKSTHKNKTRTPLVEKYLITGKLADGETALITHLEQHSSDDQARFGLGVLQFMRAIERLSQDLYRYGLRDSSTHGIAGPLLRLPVPHNPEPEILTYWDGRTILDTFSKNILNAEATLALITDPKVKLPLRFKIIRLDLNGDGLADDDESLWKVYANVTDNRQMNADQSKDFIVCFDRGDVHWLRGYCHLLATICDVYLARDTKETFDCTAHLFFAKVDSPYPFLNKGKHVHNITSDDIDVLDLVELIHSIRWTVVEPKRMELALHHLEAVVAQSNESWKWIMAETDDDHEWLPNPKQTGVIPNVRVTQEMIVTWTEIMNEIDKLLSGKLLVPFWRGDDDYGVNVRKVFLEPRTLDLILWVQGAAAAPYLQKGELTDRKIWGRWREVFGHNFPGFALWFN